MNAWPVKMPIILHTKSVYSNAMVPYAPKRMEFFTCPPQSSYSQKWIDQLVLHETRHAIQFQKTDQGFTRALYYIFGQQATAAILGAFVPFWFIEGDATLTETALSKSGRGRVPSFEMDLRAQLLEKGIYKYNKAYNGSYKDFTANWYQLGYNLVSLSRKKYGADVWSNVLDKVARKPYTFVPFTTSLKSQTGKGKLKLYNELTENLQDAWKDQNDQLKFTRFEKISRETKYYTNYKLSTFISDSIIVVEKTSMDDIARFVSINLNSKKEKKILSPGTNYHKENLTSNAQLICWSERTFDPRWQLRDYSVIKVYDLKNKKRSQFTHRSRLFVPAISPDGKLIAAVEVTDQNKYSLVILDALQGNIVKKIFAPDNQFFMTPEWSEDNHRITCILLGDNGKSLVIVNSRNGEIDYLIPSAFQEISKPSFIGDDVIFTASWSGIENIYIIKTDTRKTFQVTSAKYGATDAVAAPDGKSIIYSNYTADGYEIVQILSDPSEWKPLDKIEDNSLKLYETMSAQEGFTFRSQDVPDSTYKTKAYRKGGHLFNFHSWTPVSFDIDNISLNPGIMIMSQNLLSSSFLTAGYEYNLNEEAGKVYLKYTYEGSYPVIDIQTDYGLRRGTHVDEDGNYTQFKYTETNLSPSVYIPLRFHKNQYYRGVRPLIGGTFTYRKMDKDSPLEFTKDRFFNIDYQLYLYNQIKTSLRDLQPKWGQSLMLTYRNLPFDSEDNSSIFGVSGILYFPGILNHHGLRIYGAYQQRITDFVQFSDVISYPRGFSSMHEDEMISLKADYVLPLFYPDWQISSLLYFKRFSSRIFYDFGLGRTGDIETTYNSVGVDLTTDVHFFSLFFPFEIGVRGIYKPEFNNTSFQFLINMDLSY